MYFICANCSIRVYRFDFTFYLLNTFSMPVSLSLICSNFYWLFIAALPKKLPIILILFSYHYLLFPYYSFAIMFQVATHWQLEKQELDMYQFCCRFIVQLLMIEVKRSMEVILAFSWLTHLSCICHAFATDFNI